MTRTEHIEWCKQRAREYLDGGDWSNAWASMASDLNKHPETQGHIGIEMGMMQIMAGLINTEPQMREFIEGFN